MPFVERYFYIVASISLTGYLIILFSYLFNPLLAAFIIALALKPLVDILEKNKIPRILSTLISVVFLMFFILFLIIFFSTLLGNVDLNLESWQGKFNGISGRIKRILDWFEINPTEQAHLSKETFSTFLKNSTALLNNTLTFTTNFLSTFVIFVLALFFFLYYRSFLVCFLYKIFNKPHHQKIGRILNKIQTVVIRYVFGLSLIILAVAVLNIIGLIILNIDNAVLFGSLAAVLTLIPYVGISIGALIPVIFAFFTKDSLWYPVGVLAIFMGVQFLEGNFLTPNIIGHQVSLNPFAAIIGLIIGGMVLGLIGIIFALPVLAIVKVICDEIPSLQPIGFVMGNPPDSLSKK